MSSLALAKSENPCDYQFGVGQRPPLRRVRRPSIRVAWMPPIPGVGQVAAELHTSVNRAIEFTSEAREAIEFTKEARQEEIRERLFGAIQGAEHGVRMKTFINALVFMQLLPRELPLPRVVMESEREIGLDWDADPDRVVSLTIDSSHQIEYASLIGNKPRYGKIKHVHGVPKTLPKPLKLLLEQGYPSA